jgi:SAM-dependent methyltransferase
VEQPDHHHQRLENRILQLRSIGRHPRYAGLAQVGEVGTVGRVGKGWEDWQWDETLFQGAAAYYERGRLPSSPELAASLQAALGLDGHGRLLDVGCGPGTVARRVADLFDEVVGIDADSEMIDEARRLSAAEGPRHARWVRMRAEDLPADLGVFRVVTFAASFHWMDRPVVARAVRTMLEAERGVVVHVDNRHQDSLAPSLLPPVPRAAIDELRVRHLGPDRRAGASVRNTSPGDEPQVFRAAGFRGPQVVVVPDGRHVERSVDDVVAEVFSMSSTAPHLFGERTAEFEAELRTVLTAAAGGEGRFGVRLPDNVLNIWRPAPAGSGQ